MHRRIDGVSLFAHVLGTRFIFSALKFVGSGRRTEEVLIVPVIINIIIIIILDDRYLVSSHRFQ